MNRDEQERVRRALDEAPRTETGIIIPPHVAAERQREQQPEPEAKPNRAQRRAMRKQLPREQRIAQTRRLPDTVLMDEETAAALAGLSEEQREAAVKEALILKELGEAADNLTTSSRAYAAHLIEEREGKP